MCGRPGRQPRRWQRSGEGVAGISGVRRITDLGLEVPAPVGERPRSPAPSASFGRELGQARLGSIRERMQELLGRIDDLGARLAAEMTIANLRAYREAVRGFLAELQQAAVTVQTDLEWDYQAWQHRSLTVLRTVDAELEELGRMVLDHEQDRLKILAKIGEIKGMLLDVKL